MRSSLQPAGLYLHEDSHWRSGDCMLDCDMTWCYLEPQGIFDIFQAIKILAHPYLRYRAVHDIHIRVWLGNWKDIFKRDVCFSLTCFNLIDLDLLQEVRWYLFEATNDDLCLGRYTGLPVVIKVIETNQEDRACMSISPVDHNLRVDKAIKAHWVGVLGHAHCAWDQVRIRTLLWATDFEVAGSTILFFWRVDKHLIHWQDHFESAYVINIVIGYLREDHLEAVTFILKWVDKLWECLITKSYRYLLIHALERDSYCRSRMDGPWESRQIDIEVVDLPQCRKLHILLECVIIIDMWLTWVARCFECCWLDLTARELEGCSIALVCVSQGEPHWYN